MPTLQQLTTSQAQKEIEINENFEACSIAATLAHKNQDTEGLTFKYYGGKVYNPLTGAVVDYADGTITLTASATNYIQLYNATVIKDTALYPQSIPLYTIITGTEGITSITDNRVQIYAPYNANIFDDAKFNGNHFAQLVFDGISSGFNISVKGGDYRRTGDTLATVATNSSLVLLASSTNYIYISTSNVFALSTTLPESGILLYKITTDTTKITALQDFRNSSNVVQTDKYYEITQSTLAANTKYTFTHNLYLGSASEKPVFLRTMLKCLTTEHGYAVGDECEFQTGATQNDSNKTGFFSNSMADVNCVLGANTYVADLTGGNIGNQVLATLANWAVVLRVYVV